MDSARATALINEHSSLPGALLPVLHALQDEFGYIDPAAIPLIAQGLNISEADVFGVIGFYHDFRQKPPGKHVLKVCRAESCQAMGCENLIRHIEGTTGVKLGETSPDRGLTLEAVYCLGNCALSPALMLDGEVFGRVSPSVADVLLASARRPA